MHSTTPPAGIGPADRRDQAAECGSLTLLLPQLKACDPAVLAEIWRRFFPRMAGLARKALAALPNCGVDAEDAAQGAFVSFWRALDGGRGFEFANRNDLWKLLGIMTTRKARKMARRQLAKKRGGGRIRLETDLRGTATEQMPVDSPLDSGSAEIRPAEFDLCCEEMLLALDDEHRTTAILRLQGYSSQEIASRLNCSPRSIQRKLQVIRGAWERMALAE